MIELKFVNSDARPKTVALQVATAAVPHIMDWYGAYFAGDRYAVYLDGEKIVKDHNGEMIP